MKRSILLALVLSLVIGSVPAQAAPKKKKKKAPAPIETTLTYTRPALGTAGAGLATEGLTVTVPSTHAFATIEVADDASPTAHVSFAWDTDGDGVGDQGFTVCGKTDGPIEVPAGATLIAFPWALPGPECPTGFSTSGTIKVILTSTPG